MKKRVLFTLPDDSEVFAYTLTNKNGMTAELSQFGAAIAGIDVVVNGKKLHVTKECQGKDWLDNKPYFGVVAGRTCNRIKNGIFKLNGTTYQLPINNGYNSLHGGKTGFSHMLWNCANVSENSVEFTLSSPDGDQGYPAKLDVRAVYTLGDDNSLTLELYAVSDADTICNLTNHVYFNLSGGAEQLVLDQVATIMGESYVEVGEGLIPNGNLPSVDGTPLDFRKPTRIGDRIDESFDALTFGGGYDLCYKIKDADGTMKTAAVVECKSSGVTLEVSTNQVGIQFYTGNTLGGEYKDCEGKPIVDRAAFCLEAQGLSDAINNPNFPSIVLKKGEQYYNKAVYRFIV